VRLGVKSHGEIKNREVMEGNREMKGYRAGKTEDASGHRNPFTSVECLRHKRVNQASLRGGELPKAPKKG